MNDKENALLDIQIWATIGFILASIISIVLTYNQKLNKTKRNGFLSKNQERDLIIFNRLFSLLLVSIFLYVNYETLIIAKSKNKKLSTEIEQLIAGILTLIAALFAMDVSFKDLKKDNLSSNSNFLNPIL